MIKFNISEISTYFWPPSCQYFVCQVKYCGDPGLWQWVGQRDGNSLLVSHSLWCIHVIYPNHLFCNLSLIQEYPYMSVCTDAMMLHSRKIGSTANQSVSHGKKDTYVKETPWTDPLLGGRFIWDTNINRRVRGCISLLICNGFFDKALHKSEMSK